MSLGVIFATCTISWSFDTITDKNDVRWNQLNLPEAAADVELVLPPLAADAAAAALEAATGAGTAATGTVTTWGSTFWIFCRYSTITTI